MAQDAEQFLNGWTGSYVLAKPVVIEDVDWLLEDIEEDAAGQGITANDLNRAAGGDLRSHLETLIRALDSPVVRRSWSLLVADNRRGGVT